MNTTKQAKNRTHSGLLTVDEFARCLRVAEWLKAERAFSADLTLPNAGHVVVHSNGKVVRAGVVIVDGE